MTIAPTPVLDRKIAKLPEHIQEGVKAYRASLNRRQDWIDAVADAIRASDASRLEDPSNSPRNGEAEFMSWFAYISKVGCL